MIGALNREQEGACLLEPAPIAVVLAGAGAGKTRLLAAKIVEDQESIGRDSQVIVTFTNAAADELRDRVVEYGGSIEVRHLGIGKSAGGQPARDHRRQALRSHRQRGS